MLRVQAVACRVNRLLLLARRVGDVCGGNYVKVSNNRRVRYRSAPRGRPNRLLAPLRQSENPLASLREYPSRVLQTPRLSRLRCCAARVRTGTTVLSIQDTRIATAK